MHCVSQKIHSFFLQPDSSSTQLSLISFKAILLDCAVTVLISACIKKLTNIGEFLCSHFNVEDGRKKATFLAYYVLLFKKGKNVTATPKKRCVQCTEKRLCQKWFVKFHEGNFSLDDAPWLGRPVEVHSYQIETFTENNQCYTMWGDNQHTQNIQIKCLKITCTNLVMLITNAWVPHQLSEKKPS